MVTTAIVSHVLLLSVAARRRVMPGPGVCCVPDPTGVPDSGPPGTRIQPRADRGCGAGARSQPADADCATACTPCQPLLWPQGIVEPQASGRCLRDRAYTR